MDTTEFKSITVNVSLERTLFLEKDPSITDEEFLNKAKKEILLPHDALAKVNDILKKVGVKINGLDLLDWEITNTNYKINE